MRGKFVFSRSNNSKTFRIILTANSSLAFTLIEILIVVAIIGVLSAGFIILIDPQRHLQKARDSQRKSDLRQIQSAIEVYRADCGEYPSSPLGSSLTASCNGPSVTYMQIVPRDPKTNRAYYYCTASCPGVPASALYTIYACIENTSDPDGTSGSIPALGCPSGTTKYIKYSNP